MGFLLEQKTNILNNRKTELCKLHDSLNKYTGIETKLKNMAKAMIVCFDLSEYEARYYAVIFNDMSIKDSIPEWEIFPATVYVESRFVPNLKSNKGAEGLMQLLDSTAMEQAKILNIQYNKHTINNQFLNVVMGCNYLAEGIKRDGIENAAKYYIAGPKYASRRDTTKAYMDEYDIEVMRKFHELQHEYVKLCYVYKGVISEN
jgi:hypothetical protein